MMQENTEFQSFSDDLDHYIKGEVSADTIREHWSKSSDVIASIMANVDHLLSDEDIREKDSSYREMQLSEAEKLIRMLREGRSVDEMREIHFLGYSKQST